MGTRNKHKELLGRLESKTLDSKFLHEIQHGLNCSPFESEAVDRYLGRYDRVRHCRL